EVGQGAPVFAAVPVKQAALVEQLGAASAQLQRPLEVVGRLGVLAALALGRPAVKVNSAVERVEPQRVAVVHDGPPEVAAEAVRVAAADVAERRQRVQLEG